MESGAERTRTVQVSGVLRVAAGLAELGARVGSEITTLAHEMHAASASLSGASTDLPTRAIYAAIGLGFEGAARLASLGGRIAPRELEGDAWLDVQSALNGVFGHLYARSGSAFALPMALHRSAPPARRDRELLFVHGLCMNERAWAAPAHRRFVVWARERLGAEVAYLRYNTGLRISANAASLAQLLEREAPERELILVGHSMGGLLALGAVHQALDQGLAWPRRVTHLACLGAPHQGASLERIGNHANRVLRLSRWSRPFMRLGDLRSDGIRDLRFGHVLEADWRGRPCDDPRRVPSGVRLAPHVAHLFVAASRSAPGELDWVGDWLVSVESALAHELHRDAALRRERIHALDHLGLLADERPYRVLRDWLERGDAV